MQETKFFYAIKTYSVESKGEVVMGMISYVKEEIQVIRERDPAIKSNMEVFL